MPDPCRVSTRSREGARFPERLLFLVWESAQSVVSHDATGSEEVDGLGVGVSHVGLDLSRAVGVQ